MRLLLALMLTGAVTVSTLGPGLGASGAVDGWAGPEAAAVREMLEGTSGRREMWSQAPELVVVTSVLDYATTDVSTDHMATGESLTTAEVSNLVADMTRALSVFTAGKLSEFSAVKTEAIPASQTTKLLRKGQIVVARFAGFQAKSGTLGYGSRMTRQGAIAAGVVMLDRDFDRKSNERSLLRTHELGHAMGYNHVQSRKSVMNPQVGTGVTDFDRTAVEVAYSGFAAPIPTFVQARN